MSSMYCQSVIDYDKDESIKHRKAFDSTAYSSGRSSKSSPKLERSLTSRRIDDVKEVQEVALTLEADDQGGSFGVEVVTNAKVIRSIDCEDDEDLSEGWNITFKFRNAYSVRSHPSRWLEKSFVLSEHRFTKNIVAMKMLSSLYSNLSDVVKEDKAEQSK